MRVCRVDGCEKPTGVLGTAKGLCSAHYNRQRRHGSLELPQRPTPVRILTCEFDGCEKPQRAHRLCATHWKRLHRYGDVTVCKRHDWTPEEDARLLDLPTYPRSGMVRFGWLADLALHLGRTDSAARTRLAKLRRRGAARTRNEALGRLVTPW